MIRLMKTSPLNSTDIDLLHQTIREQQEHITYLLGQIRLMKHRQFGRKADVVNLDQLALFLSDDVELIPLEDDEDTSEKAKLDQNEKKKEPRKALRFLKEVEVIREDIELPEEERFCDCCGGELHDIGSDITRQIEYIPAQLKQKEIHTHKYGCRSCEIGVKKAPAPRVPLFKSMAAASLLAFIIVSKYVDYLPLYRIQKRFQRLGLYLPDSTQGQWMMQCGELFQDMVNLMAYDIRKRGYLFTDDTIQPMLNDDPDRHRVVQARLWVYQVDEQLGPPIVVYDFSRSRSSQHPRDFLEGYKGYLSADGYPGYDKLFASGDIVEVFCWCHVQRKFCELAIATGTEGRAHYMVGMIKKLFRIERRTKYMSCDERKAYRLEHAKPILDKLQPWLEAQLSAIPPRGDLAKVIRYTLGNWKALTRYLEAGYLKMDNNTAERSMRCVALSRKNSLFVGNERAGSSAANLFSIVETCRANGINPLSYLTDVLPLLPSIRNEDELRALLPYSDAIKAKYSLIKAVEL